MRETKCPFCTIALAVVAGSLLVACAENPPRPEPVYGGPPPRTYEPPPTTEADAGAPAAPDAAASTPPPAPTDDGRQVKPMYGMPSPRQ